MSVCYGKASTARRPTATTEPGAAVFVWCVWASMAAIAAGFVVRYGPDLPVWDDFDVVSVVAGGRRVTLEWLWSPHNEHRVPLTRLILLALYRLSGNDFRVGMFFNVAVLAALAGASIVVAGRRRGGARSYDALFPLVLLNLCHHANLLWSWQIQFGLGTSLAGAVVLVIVSRDGWPGPARAWGVGAGLAALCLCGANGVALVPAPAAWLVAAAFAHGRTKRGLAVFAASVPCLVLTVLYFSGDHGTKQSPTAPTISAAIGTAFQCLSLMFGTVSRRGWPASGLAALAVVGLSVAVVARAALLGPTAERPRALGLLCAFAAFGSLVLGLGWGRAGAGEGAGFEPRYATLVAPIWVAVVFAWDFYTPPASRRVALNGLMAVVLVLLWPNAQDAVEYGGNLARQAGAFVQDVKAGVPPYLLVKRYTPFLHPSQDVLAEELAALRHARIGLFRQVRPDPEFREIAVPVVPVEVTQARWEGRTAYVTGVDPELRFVLPESVPVAAIRLKYSHHNRVGGPARFRFRWGPGGRTYSNWTLPTGPGRVTMIRVADRVKEFSIQPDNQPCEFTIVELALLVLP